MEGPGGHIYPWNWILLKMERRYLWGILQKPTHNGRILKWNPRYFAFLTDLTVMFLPLGIKMKRYPLGTILRFTFTERLNTYEVDSKEPIAVEKLSPKTLSQVRGVVGFQIEIKEIMAAYKLSQTREEDDHRRIIKELEKKDPASKAIANAMKKDN